MIYQVLLDEHSFMILGVSIGAGSDYLASQTPPSPFPPPVLASHWEIKIYLSSDVLATSGGDAK